MDRLVTSRAVQSCEGLISKLKQFTPRPIYPVDLAPSALCSVKVLYSTSPTTLLWPQMDMKVLFLF